MLRGPKYKICKRVGGSVFPQCQNPKFTSLLAKRAMGGKKGRPKPKSEYGSQFLEKQKAKFTFGVNERQFHNYVLGAEKIKGSNPAVALNQLLERRADNLIYRLGLASSRTAARQLVSHGHIKVNDKKITVPSYSLNIGDKVSVKKESRGKKIFADMGAKLKGFKFPKWVKFDEDSLTAEVIRMPEQADGDLSLNFPMVVEFYSRT